MNDEHRWLETGRLAELGLLSAELIHEIRQPIFAVKAALQLLETGRGENTEAHIQLALQQVEVLESLLSRYAGSGRRPTAHRLPMLLRDPVTAGVELLRGRARTRQITLDLVLTLETTPTLADPIAVQQITSNLVQNALDAARSRVEVHVASGLVLVVDDGPGLPPPVVERMFEPFYTTKPPGMGTGLGLSVTRHLLELLGGLLQFDSDDKGTRFYARFATLDGAPDAR